MPTRRGSPDGTPVAAPPTADPLMEVAPDPPGALDEHRRALRHYNRALRALRVGQYEGLSARQRQALRRRLEANRAQLRTLMAASVETAG